MDYGDFQKEAYQNERNKRIIDTKRTTSDKPVVVVFAFMFLIMGIVQIMTAKKSGMIVFAMANENVLDWGIRCFGYLFPILAVIGCLVYIFFFSKKEG